MKVSREGAGSCWKGTGDAASSEGPSSPAWLASQICQKIITGGKGNPPCGSGLGWGKHQHPMGVKVSGFSPECSPPPIPLHPLESGAASLPTPAGMPSPSSPGFPAFSFAAIQEIGRAHV